MKDCEKMRFLSTNKDAVMHATVSKLLVISFILSLASSFACSQQPMPDAKSTTPAAPDAAQPVTTPRPEWIDALIAKYESEPIANPQREIFRYKFEGKIVYYVPPICCDIPSQLFSEEGKLICYPDGGFTGRGDDRCPTFHKLKREEQLVWKDGRERTRIEKPR
jgi:hypothetical protein